MKAYLIMMMAVFVGLCADAQPPVVWQNTVGNPGDLKLAGKAIECADHALVIVGTGGNDTCGGSFLLQATEDGRHILTRWFDRPGYEILLEGIVQCPDSGFLMSGTIRTHANPESTQDLYLVRTDVHGDTLWTRTFSGMGSDDGVDVQRTDDGGFIVGGLTSSTGPELINPWLVKLDSTGQTFWQNVYGTDCLDYAMSCGQLPDGGYFLASCIEPVPNMQRYFYLIRTNAYLDTLWTSMILTQDGTLMEGVYQPADSSFILAGWSDYPCDGSYSHFAIAKFGSTGDLTWMRTYGHPYTLDGARCVTPTPDGGCLVGGFTQSRDEYHDALIYRLDTSGDSLWSMRFPDDPGWMTQCQSIVPTFDGGCMLVCNTGPGFNFGCDVLLIKLGPEGNAADPHAAPVVESKTLLSNYPNPFNSVTEVTFQIPRVERVRISIYDLLGREVKTVLDQRMPSGTHNVSVDASGWPSGTYLCRLESASVSLTRRMVLLK